MIQDAREIALTVLLDIDRNHTFSNIALNKALRINQFTDKQNRAFVTRLVEGVTERQLLLDYYINRYSKTKVNKLRPQVRIILRMGIYQLLYMDSVPDRAACSEAVRMMKKHGMASLSGYVNGVLRTVVREKEGNTLEAPQEIWLQYSTPEWLWDFLNETYGRDRAETILSAQYKERGTTIRCNETVTSRRALKERLQEAGIQVEEGHYSQEALIISGYDFIRRVPGYREGAFSVQDESSMCAVEAAGIQPGDRVLDLCAAPGGKSCYAAELLKGTGTVISRDLTREKTELIRDNVSRLGLSNITVEEWDATKTDQSFLAQADVVIADVPCSGLGIIGRKNDIKYKMNRENMQTLAQLAREILNQAAAYVKPGGTLLFSTCTINPEENEENARWFTANHPEYHITAERTFLQGVDFCDGFYYAVMKKEQ